MADTCVLPAEQYLVLATLAGKHTRTQGRNTRALEGKIRTLGRNAYTQVEGGGGGWNNHTLGWEHSNPGRETFEPW